MSYLTENKVNFYELNQS